MIDGFTQLTKDMWEGHNLENRFDSQLSDAEWKVVWEWKKDLVKYFLIHEHITNCNAKPETGKPQKKPTPVCGHFRNLAQPERNPSGSAGGWQATEVQNRYQERCGSA